MEVRSSRMSTEPEHLAQLRARLEAVRTKGDNDALRQAVEVLLKVAIAHHESTGLGVPQEETPPFMEPGEPVIIPTTL